MYTKTILQVAALAMMSDTYGRTPRSIPWGSKPKSKYKSKNQNQKKAQKQARKRQRK